MKNQFSVAILVKGLSGLVAQILLLRELLIVFSGNELSIGIVLANWLILGAFGSYVIGRRAERSKYSLEVFVLFTVIFSLSLLIAIYLTRNLKGVMGISIGESIGFLPMLFSSLLALSVVSILQGALFTYSCRIYSRFSSPGASAVGRVYVYETVGTIIGGIACTYLLIPYFNSFQASTGIALLNFIVCLFLVVPSWKTGLYQKTVVVVLSLLIFLSGYLLFTGKVDELHDYSVKAQWKNQNIVHYQNSQYGNICVLENEGQYIFFLDGIPNLITPIPDIPSLEEYVHLPLLSHPEPAKLLILSGGAGGMINEALKHPSIEAIEYAELDPLMLDLLRKFPTPLTESELNDRRVKIKHVDGRLLLKTTESKYDVIFVGIQEPSNLQANRFFTKEFFSLVKEKLNKGGILVLGLPGSLTYLNEELRNLNSSIFHTLESVFSHIRVIPGDGRNLFLSSDSLGTTEIDKVQIIERLSQRNIAADVIVPWHIEKKIHPGWQDWFSRFIEEGSHKINSDFTPVGVFYSISHWNAVFAPSLRGTFSQIERINLKSVVLLFVSLLLAYIIFRPKKRCFFRGGISLSIITTGFAAMMFVLMIIFAFQSIYGYVFSSIGILVASFMAGAASGAMLITSRLERIKNYYKLFIKIELAIIGFSIVFPVVFLAVSAYLGSSENFFIFMTLFLVISLISGFLAGSQFPLANKLYLGRNSSLSKTAGLLYASDLLGGWLGGIVGAVVLLPVLGLAGSCITVGLIKLTSFTVIATQHDSI
ncbi:MAG: fused MFS/spermidine synthase [Deltaproteobacteria bacterium]|nr:fused MFS/spermidine synthase [Deltaproteobacteria bacterium]